MSRLSESIKQHDMFGHPVSLNFDQKGDCHQTPIGGFFSIFIKLAIWTYVIFNFKKMLFNESDNNFT